MVVEKSKQIGKLLQCHDRSSFCNGRLETKKRLSKFICIFSELISFHKGLQWSSRLWSQLLGNEASYDPTPVHATLVGLSLQETLNLKITTDTRVEGNNNTNTSAEN